MFIIRIAGLRSCTPPPAVATARHVASIHARALLPQGVLIDCNHLSVCVGLNVHRAHIAKVRADNERRRHDGPHAAHPHNTHTGQHQREGSQSSRHMRSSATASTDSYRHSANGVQANSQAAVKQEQRVDSIRDTQTNARTNHSREFFACAAKCPCIKRQCAPTVACSIASASRASRRGDEGAKRGQEGTITQSDSPELSASLELSHPEVHLVVLSKQKTGVVPASRPCPL
jgi:hypothetical protein